jgi:hypothetical protein
MEIPPLSLQTFMRHLIGSWSLVFSSIWQPVNIEKPMKIDPDHLEYSTKILENSYSSLRLLGFHFYWSGLGMFIRLTNAFLPHYPMFFGLHQLLT